MKKTVLTFGLISGALSSLMMVATVPFAHRIGFNKALIVGYTTIVLSFLLVFFGIRSYRDNASNGQITFTKAFAVGISITLTSWTTTALIRSRSSRPRARVLQPSRCKFSN